MAMFQCQHQLRSSTLKQIAGVAKALPQKRTSERVMTRVCPCRKSRKRPRISWRHNREELLKALQPVPPERIEERIAVHFLVPWS